MPTLTEQTTAIVLKMVKPGMSAEDVAKIYRTIFATLRACQRKEPKGASGHAPRLPASMPKELANFIRREMYGLKET